MNTGLKTYYCMLPNGKVQAHQSPWKPTHAVAARNESRDWYAHSWCSSQSAAERCYELTQQEQGVKVEVLRVTDEVPEKLPF